MSEQGYAARHAMMSDRRRFRVAADRPNAAAPRGGKQDAEIDPADE